LVTYAALRHFAGADFFFAMDEVFYLPNDSTKPTKPTACEEHSLCWWAYQ